MAAAIKMQNSYDYIAEQWHSNRRAQAYLERALGYVDRTLEGLPAGSKVLDLGCGTGEPIARHLLQKGFRVIGLDQSKPMLEIAKSVVPEAVLIHGDMVDIQLEEKFAAAIAWDSIFHVERRFHSAIFRKIANAVEPDGRLLLSVGGSGVDGNDPASEFGLEGFTSEMFGHTFFYSGYEPAVTRRLLEAEGFEIDLWEVDDPSSRGHIAVIARKANLPGAS